MFHNNNPLPFGLPQNYRTVPEARAKEMMLAAIGKYLNTPRPDSFRPNPLPDNYDHHAFLTDLQSGNNIQRATEEELRALMQAYLEMLDLNPTQQERNICDHVLAERGERDLQNQQCARNISNIMLPPGAIAYNKNAIINHFRANDGVREEFGRCIFRLDSRSNIPTDSTGHYYCSGSDNMRQSKVEIDGVKITVTLYQDGHLTLSDDKNIEVFNREEASSLIKSVYEDRLEQVLPTIEIKINTEALEQDTRYKSVGPAIEALCELVENHRNGVRPPLTDDRAKLIANLYNFTTDSALSPDWLENLGERKRDGSASDTVIGLVKEMQLPLETILGNPKLFFPYEDIQGKVDIEHERIKEMGLDNHQTLIYQLREDFAANPSAFLAADQAQLEQKYNGLREFYGAYPYYRETKHMQALLYPGLDIERAETQRYRDRYHLMLQSLGINYTSPDKHYKYLQDTVQDLQTKVTELLYLLSHLLSNGPRTKVQIQRGKIEDASPGFTGLTDCEARLLCELIQSFACKKITLEDLKNSMQSMPAANSGSSLDPKHPAAEIARSALPILEYVMKNDAGIQASKDDTNIYAQLATVLVKLGNRAPMEVMIATEYYTLSISANRLLKGGTLSPIELAQFCRCYKKLVKADLNPADLYDPTRLSGILKTIYENLLQERQKIDIIKVNGRKYCQFSYNEFFDGTTAKLIRELGTRFPEVPVPARATDRRQQDAQQQRSNFTQPFFSISNRSRFDSSIQPTTTTQDNQIITGTLARMLPRTTTNNVTRNNDLPSTVGTSPTSTNSATVVPPVQQNSQPISSRQHSNRPEPQPDVVEFRWPGDPDSYVQRAGESQSDYWERMPTGFTYYDKSAAEQLVARINKSSRKSEQHATASTTNSNMSFIDRLNSLSSTRDNHYQDDNTSGRRSPRAPK